LEDQIANVARTKDNYEKLMKWSELLKDALVKCEKDEVNQPDNKKFKDNTKRASEAYNQSVEKGKKAEDEYQTAVKKANEEIDSYKTKNMPAVLEKFQKWQESRWNITVNAVKKYAALESETFPTSIETYVNDLKESASKASIEEDFKQFVDANKKDQTVALFSFVKFVGKYINTEEKKRTTNSSEIIHSSFNRI